MKRLFSFSLLLASILALTPFVTSASAQAPTQSSGVNIAVIDIPTIFKNHALFKKQMEDMKAEAKGIEQGLVKTREQMTGMVKELQSYKSGSLEYKNLEKQIAEMQSDVQVKMQLQKKDFMEREARIYYNVYNHIKQEVQNFALQHNIALVLRYNSTAIDPDNRQSVLEGVNRPVIFQNRVDITYEILQKLNAGVPPVADNRGLPRNETPQPR